MRRVCQVAGHVSPALRMRPVPLPMRTLSAAAVSSSSSASGMTFNRYPFLRSLGLAEMNHGNLWHCESYPYRINNIIINVCE
jgi:hypothetical protein